MIYIFIENSPFNPSIALFYGSIEQFKKEVEKLERKFRKQRNNWTIPLPKMNRFNLTDSELIEMAIKASAYVDINLDVIIFEKDRINNILKEIKQGNISEYYYCEYDETIGDGIHHKRPKGGTG